MEPVPEDQEDKDGGVEAIDWMAKSLSEEGFVRGGSLIFIGIWLGVWALGLGGI